MTKSAASRSRRWLTRVIVGVPAILLCLAAIGASYQAIGERHDRRALRVPGRLVQVDGHPMHLSCSGQGSPTVVLEAGATGFAQTWAWIQPELSRTTRVCSYDRPGLGWSGEWETGHDGATIAGHLKALLHAAGEPGPYVFVGHSLGGSLIQGYAALYPDDVAGLGFVDPSHPDQLERFDPDVVEQQRRFSTMIGYAAKLGHLGVLRATNALGRLAHGLPDSAYRAARLFASSPQHLRNAHAEMLAWDATMDAARQARTLGDRPVVVISATAAMEGMPADMLETNQAMHGEIAAMSSSGRHVELAGADHYSLLMDREHAQRTATILADLVRQVREQGAQPE